MRVKLIIFAALFFAFVSCSLAEDLRYKDPRYCGVENIKRNKDGSIKRSSKVLDDFQKIWACPDTGLNTGPCEHLKDHIIPLADGGCDAVINIQWLNPQIKSGKGPLPKDRWELKAYKYPVIIVPVQH